MKAALIVTGIIIAVLIAGLFVCIGYVYLTNRTVDQTLAKDTTISNDWIELTATPPLDAFRAVQELAIALPDHHIDRNEKLPPGQIRLPDGRIASLQIEGVDLAGNTIAFHKSGFTFSSRDLVIYRPDLEIKNNGIAKIRIRSDISFTCEEVFWRNRNPK